MKRFTILFTINLLFQSNFSYSEIINYETNMGIIDAKLYDSLIILSDSKERKICTIDLNSKKVTEIIKGYTAWDIKTFKDQVVLLLGGGNGKIMAVSYNIKNTKIMNAFEHGIENRLTPYPRIIDSKLFVYQTGDTFYVKELFANHLKFKQIDSDLGNLSPFFSHDENPLAFSQSNTDMYSFALVKINQDSFEIKNYQLDTIYNFIFALPGFSVNLSNGKIYFGRSENDQLKIFVMDIYNDKCDIKLHKTFNNADAILDIRGDKILLKNKTSFLIENL